MTKPISEEQFAQAVQEASKDAFAKLLAESEEGEAEEEVADETVEEEAAEELSDDAAYWKAIALHHAGDDLSLIHI